MPKNNLRVISPDKDTSLRLKEILEKEFGSVPGFAVSIDLKETNIVHIEKEHLNFLSFLDVCHICENLGCHVIS